MDEMVAKISAVFDKIEKKIDGLGETITHTLNSAPDILDDVIDKVVEGWNWFLGKLKDFWAWVNKLFGGVGDPSALHAASQAWATKVGNPVGALSADLGDSHRKLKNSWVGDASTAYADHLPEQKATLDSIGEKLSGPVGDALDSIGNAIADYWQNLLLIVVPAFVLAIIFAEGEAVTVFGIPLAPPTALVALASFIGAVEMLENTFSGVVETASGGMEAAASAVPGTWPTFAAAR